MSEETHPLLADLVDLAVQMRRDEALDDPTRRRRDRSIGRELSYLSGNRLAQVRQWLLRVDTAQRHEGRRAVQAQRWVGIVMGVLGLVLGWLTATAVFYYDGSRPVNAVRVLAVFVGLQGLLIGLFALATAPRRLVCWMPGGRALQDLLLQLSPGRLEPLIARLLPPRYRAALQLAVGQSKSHQQLYGRVQKWAVAWWAQLAAVGFNVGALLACVTLILFTDLAFGWSTTLRLEAAAFHRLTHGLAAPWGAWLPQADPPLELVAATRFFRLKEGILPGAADRIGSNAVALGGWWPFLVACMVCYGLLPRLLMLALVHWRVTRALTEAVLHTPGVVALVDRMNHELVETAAPQPEIAQEGAPAVSPRGAGALTVAGDSVRIINWAGVGIQDQLLAAKIARQLGTVAGDVLHAGGNRPLEDDACVIKKLGGVDHESAIAIVVKAWEPPVMEWVDFLIALRREVGRGRPILVMPVATGEHGAVVAPDPIHLATWQKKVQTIGDPWLGVRVLDGGRL